MRATELLYILSKPITASAYEGIYYYSDGKPVAFTNLDVDSDGDLVLYVKSDEPPLPPKQLLTTLMLNKQRPMYTWHDGAKQIVFGAREENNKIII